MEGKTCQTADSVLEVCVYIQIASSLVNESSDIRC